MALYEVLLSEVIHQCAWCTLVTDGEKEGELYFEERGRSETLQLLRLPGYSHGCCPECRKRGFDGRKRERFVFPYEIREGAYGSTTTKQST